MYCSWRIRILSLLSLILFSIIMVLQRSNFKLIFGRHEVSTAYVDRESFDTGLDRYALCFYGLTRSVNWTIASIEEHIKEPLRNVNNNLQFDTFLHTYRLTTLNNPRAGEFGVAYSHLGDIEMLKPARYLITSQDEFDRVYPDLNQITYIKWDKVYNKATVRNIVRAQNSMALVWSIMMDYAKENNIEYKGVVFLRPDVLYLRDIDILSREMKSNVIYIPSFGSFGGYNDRFAYGSVSAMRIYANRISTSMTQNISSRKSFNSERFLAYHLKVHNVSAVKTDMVFARVRSTGEVPNKDTPFIKQACSEGLKIACDLKYAGKKQAR